MLRSVVGGGLLWLATLLAMPAGFDAAPVAAAEPRVVVEVSDYAFSPTSLVVAPGTLVVFANRGEATHRIVADDGAFGSPGLQPQHDFSYHYTTVGRFGFHCSIHPQMTGTVVVSATVATGGAVPTTGATGAQTASAQTGVAPTASTDPKVLAMTGSSSGALAAWAVACVGLGVFALSLGRKPTVVIPALVGRRNRDDLLPAHDRARR